jgi:hypothetical protein
MSGRRREAPRAIHDPQPGYFLTRLCRGGWLVPARIDRAENGDWITVIDGEQRQHPDPTEAGVFRVWLGGTPCEPWQYQDRLELKAWAATNDPDHPSLHPKRPIDPMRLTPRPVPRSVVPRAPAGEPNE